MKEPAREYLRLMGTLNATEDAGKLRGLQSRTRLLIPKISNEDAREIQRIERMLKKRAAERCSLT